MIIAIDYDRTYSKDPEAWAAVGHLLASAGHEVITLTKRRPDEPINCPWPVHYTSREAKGRYAATRGIMIDVWVDDDPLSIFQGG